MKILVLLSIAIVLLMVVSFAQEIRIKFWHSFSEKSPRGKALQELVDNFNQKKYQVDGKQIFVESVYKGGQGRYSNPYNYLFSELLKANYEKNLPDVSIAYENWVSQFEEIGIVRDFNSLNIPEIDEYINNLYPAFRNSSTINGKVYSLSFNKSIFVFYYNSNFVDHIPTNYKEFILKLEEIKNKTNIPPLYLEPNEDTFIILYLLAVSNEFFHVDQKIEPLFLGEKLDKVTELLKNLENKGLIKWTNNSYQDFIKNRAPIILATTSRYTDLKSRSKDYHISPLPADNGKIYAAGTNLVIFKSTPERELAAAKFIQFLLEKENLEKFCISTGYILPTTNQGKTYLEFLNTHPDFKNVIEYSKDRLYVQQPIWAWENVRYFISDYMLSVFINKNPIHEQKKELEQKVNQIMINQNLKFLNRKENKGE
ncbi:MAG: extracellular solute-binding protein [bacterium]|nr:extracellular solute-binding protein [bacterium]